MGAVKEELIRILDSGRWQGVQEFYGGPDKCTAREAQLIFYFWVKVFNPGLKPEWEIREGKIVRVHIDRSTHKGE